MEGSFEDSLNSTCDQLVSEGVIVSGPYTSVYQEDEGYPVSAASTNGGDCYQPADHRLT
jgi:hypothetical protein